jgi:hypothetical protein
MRAGLWSKNIRAGRGWSLGTGGVGKHCHFGKLDNPVEAAKARDRKARVPHGPYASLNFPQRWR